MKKLENENDQLKESWACQRDKMERLEGNGESEQYLRQQVEALKKENTRLRGEKIEVDVAVEGANASVKEVTRKNQELFKVGGVGYVVFVLATAGGCQV